MNDIGALLLIIAAIAALAWAVEGWLRYAPTRWLAGAALLLAPLWLLSATPAGRLVATAAAVLLLLAAVADALLLPAAELLDVEREVPATLGLGDAPSPAAYRVRSRWRGTVRGTLYDALPPAVERAVGPAEPHHLSLGGETAADASTDGGEGVAAIALAAPWAPRLRLAPGDEATLPFGVVGRERGVHPLGPVALDVTGPLGLMRRTLTYAPGDTVTVAPSIAAVRTFRLLALQHRLRDAGLRNVRRRGAGTAFASLREYVVGDDPRRVDWKATARRGTLITREYTVEQGQTVMIAVDAGRLMTQLVGTDPPVSRFEYALSSALVLADVAAHSGDAVGLILFDDEVRAFVPAARGRRALQAMRDALVPARATMAEPDYAAAFRTLAQRHRKRSLFVLFTDVIDVRASQALIAHATRGAARHLPLVVALRNDALVAAATPAPAETDAAWAASGASAAVGGGPSVSHPRTTDALYERAAAEELLSAREAALGAMRAAGVSVVDVSPTAMTAAVVNRYLELKQRGAV
ncbi:MAG TPA: DUF58 domain-containing protein [Gemmatimonadaceae bacterium]|nr:DUF58 domain-containing protein [Gemmatimonadaceae bacterium]